MFQFIAGETSKPYDGAETDRNCLLKTYFQANLSMSAATSKDGTETD